MTPLHPCLACVFDDGHDKRDGCSVGFVPIFADFDRCILAQPSPAPPQNPKERLYHLSHPVTKAIREITVGGSRRGTRARRNCRRIHLSGIPPESLGVEPVGSCFAPCNRRDWAYNTWRLTVRGVAQSGSAPVLGTGCRWFKSSRPDYEKAVLATAFFVFCGWLLGAPFDSEASLFPQAR